MDLDEWEFLPDHRFLDFPEDSDEKKFISGKRGCGSKTFFDMNYFSPSFPGSKSNSGKVPKQLVPVPFDLDSGIGKSPGDEFSKEIIIKTPVDVNFIPSVIAEKINQGPVIGSLDADQDSVSQVFFKKMKENEFVDMKMDSPKSPTSRSLVPKVDPGTFNFDDKTADQALEGMNCCSPRKTAMDFEADRKQEPTWAEDNGGGLNLWKWGLTGIGAICSFGVAAATICIIIYGSQHKTKQQQNQKLRFQIYTDDKRIKQVVQQASKLNEAISAVRGVPITRAQITLGGYYDAL
ncbi:uncharacterized protein LOC123197675 [Mangifera indica]|uniref:uncharacterized protein LOC123197675 n=1 Tax=Mangifera indica TaxID=29780 RepID=UPI001CFA22ED|nr:uncharacterized protein LOC123197675 [Mangifera indica]